MTRRTRTDGGDPRRSKRRRVLGLALSVPFVLAGSFMCWLGVGDVLAARASTDWPTVPGEVLESQVERHRGTEGSVNFTARVRYAYEVAGVRHESERVSFDRFGEDHRGSVEAIVERYPAGGAVTVHHDPDDPSAAVLEPGARGATWGFLAFGAVFLGVGSALLFTLARRGR